MERNTLSRLDPDQSVIVALQAFPTELYCKSTRFSRPELAFVALLARCGGFPPRTQPMQALEVISQAD